MSTTSAGVTKRAPSTDSHTSQALSFSMLAAALGQNGRFDVKSTQLLHAQPPIAKYVTPQPCGVADVACALGVSREQVDRLAGLRAVHADTWVHAVATLRAPWSGTFVSFDDALRWLSTAHGHGRGWTIRFEDGSKLACVRRTDPAALATFTPADAPGASESSLKVVISGQTIDGGFQVQASSSPTE